MRDKSCKVKSCVLWDARLVPTIMRTDQANTCVRFMMCCLLYCKVLLLALWYFAHRQPMNLKRTYPLPRGVLAHPNPHYCPPWHLQFTQVKMRGDKKELYVTQVSKKEFFHISCYFCRMQQNVKATFFANTKIQV